jgi:ribosomal protein L16 Arg81 hydroxylase
MDNSFSELFQQMIGGDEGHFFRQYWRRRTLFLPSAVCRLQPFYNADSFIQDYDSLDYHAATLLVSVDQEGRRKMKRPGRLEVVRTALAQGASVVLQALLLPRNLDRLPQAWKWFLDLYEFLCEYLLPGFPPSIAPYGPIAAVDIFCTQARMSTGGHYDTGDVFYFVLEGEKEWTVELVPDLTLGLQLAAKGENSTVDRKPLNPHVSHTLRCGDCLYVPAYTYHKVTSLGRTLAVSIGLPAFTEATLLFNAAARILTERAIYAPLPTFPRTQPTLSKQAEEETQERMRTRLMDWFPMLRQDARAVADESTSARASS